MTRPVRHPEWAIACPHCRARPGQRCTTINGRRLSIPSHNIRTTTWQASATSTQRNGDQQ